MGFVYALDDFLSISCITSISRRNQGKLRTASSFNDNPDNEKPSAVVQSFQSPRKPTPNTPESPDESVSVSSQISSFFSEIFPGIISNFEGLNPLKTHPASQGNLPHCPCVTIFVRSRCSVTCLHFSPPKGACCSDPAR